MTSENNSLLLNLQEVDKTTGEVVKLDVNSTSTVQPVALMRLGLFVPTLKSTGKSKANRKNVTDATEELVQLSIAKSEGYTDVKITGSRLDMDTDFKVWLGIELCTRYGNPGLSQMAGGMGAPLPGGKAGGGS